VLQAYTCIQYIHKNESKHSEMGPVRQNPIKRLAGKNVSEMIYFYAEWVAKLYLSQSVS